MPDIVGTSLTTDTLGIGDTFSSDLANNSDIDWVRIDLDAPAFDPMWINISSVDDLSGGSVTFYELYNGSYRSLGTFDLGNAPLNLFSQDRVIYAALTGATGSYDIEVQAASSYFTAPYDDLPGTGTLTLGTALSGNLDYTTDLDGYDVTLTAGRQYELTLVAPGGDSTIRLEALVNFDNGSWVQRVGSAYWAAGEPAETETFSVYETGTYTIELGMRYWRQIVDLETYLDYGYTIELTDIGAAPVNNIDAASAISLGVGTTSPQVVQNESNQFYFEFDGLAGHEYVVFANSDRPDATYLYRQSGGMGTYDFSANNGFSVEIGATDATVGFYVSSWDAGRAYDLTIIDLAGYITNQQSTSDAPFLTIDTAYVSDLHPQDIDYFQLNVVAGEFYTVTLTETSGTGQSIGIGSFGGTATTEYWSYGWNDTYQDQYRFIAQSSGTAWVYVNSGSVSTSVDYSILVEDGPYDDRANAYSSLVSPLALNTQTTAQCDSDLDRDGFAFNVIAGQTYTFYVTGPAPHVTLNDVTPEGAVNYVRPPTDYDLGDGFVEQEAHLLAEAFGLTFDVQAEYTAMTFTANTTGEMRANVRLLPAGELYTVYLTTGAPDPSIAGLLGVAGPGNDNLMGDATANTLNGYGGNDTLIGLGENDTLAGDGGNDMVNGGAGDDSLTGAFGDDTLNGQGGHDTLIAGTGADTLNGGNGNDSMLGQGGNDLMNGGAGLDTMIGGDGADTLFGGNHNDLLNGGGHGDLLRGEAGSDTIYGGLGADTLRGGTASDLLFGNESADLLLGEEAHDTIYGGTGNDTLIGGAGADRLFGEIGADQLDGGTGDDFMTGGANADSFFYRANGGRDVITDFQDDIDSLHLSRALWGGGLSAAQVISTYATSNGTHTTFDFGGGNELVLRDIATPGDLTDDLILL